MSDETEIEMALSAEEWASVREWSDALRLDLISPHDREQSIVVPLARAAKVLAVANAALSDDDPRKITRERVDLLRKAAEMIEIEYDARDNESYEVVTLRAFADALASYLPPETAPQLHARTVVPQAPDQP